MTRRIVALLVCLTMVMTMVIGTAAAEKKTSEPVIAEITTPTDLEDVPYAALIEAIVQGQLIYVNTNRSGVTLYKNAGCSDKLGKVKGSAKLLARGYDEVSESVSVMFKLDDAVVIAHVKLQDLSESMAAVPDKMRVTSGPLPVKEEAIPVVELELEEPVEEIVEEVEADDPVEEISEEVEIDDGFTVHISVSYEGELKEGTLVTLTAVVDGTVVEPVYRWQYRNPEDNVWVDIENETDQSLSFRANAVNVMYHYRVAVSDKAEKEN